MGIQFTTPNSGLIRTTGGLINPANSFTFMLWAMYSSPIGNLTDYRTIAVFGDNAYVNPYFWIGSYKNQSSVALCDNVGIEATGSVDDESTNQVSMVPGTWYHLAVTYDATSHTISFYINGWLIATIIVDMTGVVWAAERLAFDAAPLGASVSGIAVAQYRSFTSVLTIDQIKTEMISARAILPAFCDTPLSSPSDLADVSGNGNSWTPVGGMGVAVPSPIGVVGVPNLTPDTAIDIGTLPATFNQDVWDGTKANAVWYKYTAQPDDVVIGFFAFSNSGSYGGTLNPYTPEVNVYDGLTDAQNDNPYGPVVRINYPLQVAVFNGHTYYFLLAPAPSVNVNPAKFTLSVIKGPNQGAPAGSLAITDDIDGEFGLPLVLLDPLTGQVISFVNNFPVTNNVEVMDDGVILLEGSIDKTDGNEYLFMLDPNLNYLFSKIQVPPLVDNGVPYVITSDKISLFYVGKLVSNGVVKVASIFAPTGKPTGNVWTIPGGSTYLYGMAVSRNGGILYYTNGDNLIHQWDLFHNVAMPDFATAPSGYVTRPVIAGGSCDIQVLRDGTVVVPYRIPNQNHGGIIVIYNPDGSTRASVTTPNLLDRLCSALDDPNSFWAWIQEIYNPPGAPATFTQSGFSEYRNIRASDGSTISSTGMVPNSEFSYIQPLLSGTPTARFGPALSCPIFVPRSYIPPGPPGYTPPPVQTTGTIVVSKTISPSTDLTQFTFHIDGGLSPSTFTLGSGQSRTFTNVPPGSYNVTEDPVPGYTPKQLVTKA